MEEKLNLCILMLNNLRNHKESLDKEFAKLIDILKRFRLEYFYFRKEFLSRWWSFMYKRPLLYVYNMFVICHGIQFTFFQVVYIDFRWQFFRGTILFDNSELWNSVRLTYIFKIASSKLEIYGNPNNELFFLEKEFGIRI